MSCTLSIDHNVQGFVLVVVRGEVIHSVSCEPIVALFEFACLFWVSGLCFRICLAYLSLDVSLLSCKFVP